jgi:hypothetical protein
MKITHLKDHSILKAVSTASREYLTKCKPDNPKQAPSATMRESYAVETLLSLGSVISCVDQLYFSVDMLSGYRSSCTPDRMNRYDYIVFGIENYYLRLTSVFDRCLRLANVLHQLGLPDRRCNNDSIIENSHIKGTAVAYTLRELDKFTGPFRSHRNTVAHQASYSEKELDLLGMYFFLVEEDDSFKRFLYLFKKMADDFVADKKDELIGNVSNLEGLVESYFDALNPVFERRLKSCV